MAQASWRGKVGMILPTKGGAVQELLQILPDGIDVISLLNDIRHGTIQEFRDVMAQYEKQVAELADDGVDLIIPHGTPPFMLLGRDGEQKLIDQWEKKYEIPIFTSGMNQIAALKALNVEKFVGVGYDFEDTRIVSDYFTAAGFTVLEIADRPQVPWEDIDKMSPEQVYVHAKKAFLRNPEAEGIYIQGSKWRCLEIIDTIEQDCGVPVVHPVAARCWEIQKRLTVRAKLSGYGQLLAELP